jgi:hypothetical protein
MQTVAPMASLAGLALNNRNNKRNLLLPHAAQAKTLLEKEEITTTAAKTKQSTLAKMERRTQIALPLPSPGTSAAPALAHRSRKPPLRKVYFDKLFAKTRIVGALKCFLPCKQ